MYNLPEYHLNGRVFLAFRDRPVVDPDVYFQLIRRIRPLLGFANFTASTPGFYINYIRDPDVPNGGLRLNYYTINAALTIDTVEGFVAASLDLAIIRREHADRTTPLDAYHEGDDRRELNFRNVLVANTRVCLDMLEHYGDHSFESLVAFCRFVALPQGARPERILEEFFVEHSPSFNELRRLGLDRIYWNDLVHVHRASDVGLRFMVNLVTLPDASYGLPSSRVPGSSGAVTTAGIEKGILPDPRSGSC